MATEYAHADARHYDRTTGRAANRCRAAMLIAEATRA
jgi:hypothetical protein